MDENKDKQETPVYVKHKYSEEFIKWAQTPISEEETRQNEEELLRLFNSLPISAEDDMSEKKNVNGVADE